MPRSPSPPVQSVTDLPLHRHASVPLVLQYLLGVGVVALSFATHLALDPVLGAPVPFVFTLPALGVLACLLSPGPYWAAAALGLMATYGLIRQPNAGSVSPASAEAVGVAVYLATVLLIWIAARLAIRHGLRPAAAGDARQEKDELLQTVADGSATLLTYVDADLRYRFVNAAFCRYYGVAQHEVVGRHAAEVIGEARFAKLRPFVQRALAGETISYDAEIVFPSLGLRRIQIAYTPNVAPDGRVVGVTVAGNDVTDLVRSREAAAHLAAIVESTDDAVISKDLSGRIRTFNAAAERLFGYHAADIVGQHVTILFPSDRLDEEARILDRIRAGERVEHLETVRITSSGRRIDVSVTVSPIRDETGAIIGASSIARDITLRKAAEADLRRSEERLRIALEAGRMGTWDWDIATGAIAWSPALAAIFGLPPDGFCDGFDEYQRAIHPDDRDAVLAAIRASAMRGDDLHLEHRILRRDGRIAWVECRGRVILDADGGPRRMTGVCMDITARKQAEAQVAALADDLRRRVEELQTLLDLLPVGVAIATDASCTEMIGNKAACDMLGLPVGANVAARADDRDRLPVRFIKDGAEIPPHELTMQRAARLRQRISGEEYQFVRADGSVLDAWVFASPLFDDAGAVRGVLGTFVDITRRKRAEQELTRYQHRLEDLVRERTEQLEQSQNALRHSERMAALGAFAAGLGHDMTNLLMPIRARVESIEALAGDNHEIRADAAAIRGSLRFIESITRGLRLFAQDPEQDVEGVTDLRRWCCDVESLLRASLPKSFSFRCDIAPDVPTAPVAPHRLSQAVLNLVTNARDAVILDRGQDASAAIRLHAVPEDGGRLIRISVEDDGPGMPDHVRRHCLEPFFTTKRRAIGGTGLGLSIVHGVAQRAGGRVEIDSTPGRGTTVSIILPAAPPPPEDHPAGARRALITLADGRAAAFTASVLSALGYDPVATTIDDLIPDADRGPRRLDGELWITDATPHAASIAPAFLAAAPGRRIIALGGNGQWSDLGAITLPGTTSLVQLRRALDDALSPSTPPLHANAAR